jgi:hypothetical protein
VLHKNHKIYHRDGLTGIVAVNAFEVSVCLVIAHDDETGLVTRLKAYIFYVYEILFHINWRRMMELAWPCWGNCQVP